MIKKLIKKLIKDVLKENNGTIYLDTPQQSDGMNDRYMYDFRSSRNFSGNFITSSSVPDNMDSVGNEEPPKVVPKITIKPIDVVHELERKPKSFDLEMLDEKIEVLHHKEELINQNYAKREVSAMVERLENRKQYIEFREFFEQFDNTDQEKINKLLEKYDLVMELSDIFIPDFPQEAIDIMSGYSEKMKELCNKNPVFYVIAEPDDFSKAYDKRDPILLVQSPFGFFYQILGAWDKELIMLDEL